MDELSDTTLAAHAIIKSCLNAEEYGNETSVSINPLMTGILVAMNAPAIAAEVIRAVETVMERRGRLDEVRANRDQFLAVLATFKTHG